MDPKQERRSLEVEFRADAEGEGRTLRGHAATFNTLSQPIWGMFREKIDPGAFTRTIKEDDAVALWNHNARELLGRTSAGTLRLSEDKKGLAFEADLPETSSGDDVLTLVRRGDLRDMSFGFIVREEEWVEPKEGSKKLAVRTLKDVRLLDVSPVTYPAYSKTDVSVRSGDNEAGIRAFEEWKEGRDAELRRAHDHRNRVLQLTELGG